MVAGNRSEAAVSLWMISASIPGLFKQTTCAVFEAPSKSNSFLIGKIRKVLHRYKVWHVLCDQQLRECLDEAALQRGLALMIRAFAFETLMHRCLTALQ